MVWQRNGLELPWTCIEMNRTHVEYNKTTPSSQAEQAAHSSPPWMTMRYYSWDGRRGTQVSPPLDQNLALLGPGMAAPPHSCLSERKAIS
jgi:hypothetical protein